jgi:hypothetical protein
VPSGWIRPTLRDGSFAPPRGLITSGVQGVRRGRPWLVSGAVNYRCATGVTGHIVLPLPVSTMYWPVCPLPYEEADRP